MKTCCRTSSTAALAAGADAAEVAFAERQSLSVSVRLGELEEVEREESRDLGLRVFIGKRQASVSGSDVSADGRAKLVERVVAMARLAPEDPYAGLPPRDRLARGRQADLDLFDPAEPTAEALEDQALRRRGRRARRARRHQLRRRLGHLVVVGVAAGDQRRLLRRAPRHRLLALGPGDRRRGRRHGAGRRRPRHPLAGGPADTRRGSAPRPAAAPSPAWARARSPRPPRR